MTDFISEPELESTNDMDQARFTREPLRLGFARGVAPSKWERRWRAAATGQRLDLVPLELGYGDLGEPGTDTSETAQRAASCDAIVMRAAPGEKPSPTDATGRDRHALRLYTEALALVVAKDHDLAKQESVSLADLALVTLLDHPDHDASWPPATPWDEPSWMPVGPQGALKIVATGAGAILLPVPLARHLSTKRQHAVLPVRPETDSTGMSVNTVEGSAIWAVWTHDRDDAEMQQLAGILRGRTARSSRTEPEATAKPAQQTKAPKQQQPKKAAPKLKPNSRGAQLATAKAKSERKKAEARAAKKQQQKKKRR